MYENYIRVGGGGGGGSGGGWWCWTGVAGLGLQHSSIISLSTEVLRVLEPSWPGPACLLATATKNLMLLIIYWNMKHSHNNNT